MFKVAVVKIVNGVVKRWGHEFETVNETNLGFDADMLSFFVRVRSHFNFFAEGDVFLFIIGNAFYNTISLSEIIDEKMTIIVCEIMKNHWSELCNWLLEL